MTIAEGRAVVETARRYGRIYQTGTQRLSEANFVAAIEMARTGRLGKVHTVRAHIAPWDAAEMSHAWLPAEPAAAQGRGRLGRLARPLPLAAVQLGLRQGRLARPLRLPHQLHRRMGRAHLRPVPGRHRRPEHLGRRIPLRQEPHRRRHGHQVRQRREDDPPARQAGTAPAACGSRGPRAGSRSPTATRSPRSPRHRCWRMATSSSPSTSERTGRPMNHVRNFFDCVKIAPADRGQPGRHAPLDEHRPRRQHLHVAQARHEIRPRRRKSSSTTPRPTACAAGPSGNRGSSEDSIRKECPLMFRTFVSLAGVTALLVAASPLAFGAEIPGIAQGPGGQADRRPQVGRTAEGQGRRLPRAGAGRHQGSRGPAGRAARATKNSRTWPATAWSRSPTRPWTRPCATPWTRSRAGSESA